MRNIKFLTLLLLAGTVIFSACKKTDPDVLTAEYYWQARIDGTLYTYQFDIKKYINIVGDFGAGADADGQHQYLPFTCIAHEDALSSTSGLQKSGAIGVISGTSNQLSNEAVGDLIQVGSLDIGTRSYNAADAVVEGGFVSWVDEAGVEWNTNGEQSGGSFNVTEYADLVNSQGNTHKVITVTFACTLYNGLGGSVSLTDGVSRGNMIVY